MRIHRVRSVSEGIRHPRIESNGERRTDRAISRREIISPAPLLLVMMFADSEVDQMRRPVRRIPRSSMSGPTTSQGTSRRLSDARDDIAPWW